MNTKKPVLSDLLLKEIDHQWSRESVPIAAHTPTYPIGTVLARTGGNYAPVTAAATALADAVLIEESPGGETKPGVVIARGAIVARDRLVWPDGATNTEIAAGEAALIALGIVVRERL
ncbi:MAG: head decoration protein [Betaproteobacteria bacterium]|nr:head decoration protein [Betaproteobacteria bacterium]